MHHQPSLEQIEAKYLSLSQLMGERMCRQWAPAESRAYGWGGVQAVSDAIHMSPNTIRKGWAELAAQENNPDAVIDSRLRKQGGGRKRCCDSDMGVPVRVCHFPPRTSKWNKIEHRMFCYITQNWRGRLFVAKIVMLFRQAVEQGFIQGSRSPTMELLEYLWRAIRRSFALERKFRSDSVFLA